MDVPTPEPQQREVMPPMDGGYAMPEPAPAPAPRSLAPAAMPQPHAPPAQTEAPPAPMASPLAPAARPIAPAPAPAPVAAARASQPSAPVAEPRSGEDYPDLLAQVLRVARQRGADAAPGDDGVRQRLRPVVDQAARSIAQLPAGVTHDRLAKDALAELAGTGAYETLLEDQEIASASIDHQGRVSTTRAGAFTVGSHWFSSPSAAAECTERMLRAHGVDRAGRDVVHASLHDATRVTALFGALAHSGVVVQITRSARALSLNDLVSRGQLSQEAAQVLGNTLASRRNVIVAGARGSGRSTVLATLLASLPQGDRAVVVEDRDELARSRRDLLSVRAEGDWDVAVDAALDLRVGRIVFGEGADAAARGYVELLTTGAEGAMIAVAAPTGAAALARLAASAAHKKWLPQQEVAARLIATRPVVIETARLGDGQCRIVGIGEVQQGSDGSLQVAPMFSMRLGGDAAGNLVVQLEAAGGY